MSIEIYENYVSNIPQARSITALLNQFGMITLDKMDRWQPVIAYYKVIFCDGIDNMYVYISYD